MANVIDTLITRYKLDPSEYTQGAKEISAATGKTDADIQGLSKSIGSGLGGAVGMGLAAMGAILAAEIGLAKSALDASVKFSQMSAAFAGALGSMADGERVMGGLEDYAMRSAFSLEALAQASVQLVSAGLDLSRFLPLVERFALVISGTDPSGLEQVAGAFMRMKGGGFGEAMEIFRRAGIGAAELRSAGLNVSKSGEIGGSPAEVMSAIERLSQGRPKGIADSVSKSDAVKLSNLSDSVGKAMRKFGDEVSKVALPIIENISGALGDLTKGDKLKGFSEGLTGVISSFDLSKEGITSAITSVITGLENFNIVVTGIGIGLKNVFDWFIGDDSGLSDAQERKNKVDAAGKSAYEQNLLTHPKRRTPEEAALMDQLEGKHSTSDPLKTESALSDPVASAAQQTAKNTEKLVKLQEQELQRIALGGGNLARMGVVPAELRRSNRAGSVQGIGRLIESAIQEAATDQIADLVRRGHLKLAH